SSHILADIWSLCETIFVLNQGELIVEDQPENILSKMSDDSYFLTVKIGLEAIKEYLETYPKVSVIGVQNDKILFKTEDKDLISDVIKDIMKDFEIVSFGPNIPDLDQIFTRMVTAA
ncbi:MAG: DUF4162 domain-containing protein, partial [Candidatus Heimdallarchaeota archaeon]|nr:DUF4162 domain-containing protein [Candidatus Heimdallarchaeota archaeon]